MLLPSCPSLNGAADYIINTYEVRSVRNLMMMFQAMPFSILPVQLTRDADQCQRVCGESLEEIGLSYASDFCLTRFWPEFGLLKFDLSGSISTLICNTYLT